LTHFIEEAPNSRATPAAPGSIARRLDRLVGRLAEARLSPLAGLVRREKLTYLPPTKLRVVEDCLRRVQRTGVPGDLLEFGVALGGSAIVIASQMEPSRQFHGYDVFGMIPPPGAADDERSHRRYREIRDGRAVGIGGDVYYGYRTDLYERVRQAFERFGLRVDDDRIQLHRGLFEETYEADNDRRIALVHIDCDWFEPVRFCLSAIVRRLSPGALIILDDYNDYGGCRRATDGFLATHDRFRLIRHSPNAVLHYS
jgi:asparagine synthase (glutamine-hydrolysing)